jgi:hypothetical protein
MTKRKPTAIVADQESRLAARPRSAAENKWTDRWAGLSTFPSTSGTIAFFLFCSGAVVARVVLSGWPFGTALWVPPTEVLTFLGAGLGFGVIQYGTKRNTDASYQKSKEPQAALAKAITLVKRAAPGKEAA